ncbi:hypothetical protein Droror1_Dr00015925, partial [Drosera rotundifolia]
MKPISPKNFFRLEPLKPEVHLTMPVSDFDNSDNDAEVEVSALGFTGVKQGGGGDETKSRNQTPWVEGFQNPNFWILGRLRGRGRAAVAAMGTAVEARGGIGEEEEVVVEEEGEAEERKENEQEKA